MPQENEAAELSERMRRERAARHIETRTVLKKVGVSQPTLWRWEHGEGVPDVLQFVAYSEAIGLAPRELLPALGRSAPDQLLLGLEPDAAGVVIQLVDLLKARAIRKKRRLARRRA
jgi:transcriptional regulator with XRE-family HTH domain